MPVNESLVRRLVRAANEAMTEVCKDNEVEASDVLSAYMTMAKSAVIAAKEMGVDREQMRSACLTLLLECADEERKQ